MTSANERIIISVSKEFAGELRATIPAKQRSLFIEAAATEQLRRLRQKKSLQAGAGVWKDKDHPEMAELGVEEWLRRLRASWGDRARRTENRRRG